MFTTACEAVSTKRCWRSAARSICRFESNVSQAKTPRTATATTTVLSATTATKVRCGCLRRGGAGLVIRTMTGFGASTLTPEGAAPFAGPAARDARRRPGFDADEAVET